MMEKLYALLEEVSKFLVLPHGLNFSTMTPGQIVMTHWEDLPYPTPTVGNCEHEWVEVGLSTTYTTVPLSKVKLRDRLSNF